MKSEKELILQANEMLRSCYQVIQRQGKSPYVNTTNWETLENAVPHRTERSTKIYVPHN